MARVSVTRGHDCLYAIVKTAGRLPVAIGAVIWHLREY